MASYKMSQYFPPFTTSKFENIKVELDLSNYTTKTDLQKVIHVDTSDFSIKTNLNDLKILT